MMKRKFLNILMALSFLLLMNYRFIGNRRHELLGLSLFLLVLWHNCLNLYWYKAFFRGTLKFHWGLIRLMNVSLGLAFSMSMVSGLLISQFLLPVNTLSGTASIWLHAIHQGSAYLCFVLIGIHLGLHWQPLWRVGQKWLERQGIHKKYFAYSKVLGSGIIAYGVYASFAQHIGALLLMEHSFGWGTPPPAGRFFLDYLAILGCYTGITHYAIILLSRARS